ncbi:CDP-glycerol glycerophosphotransferase family protein [Knoellia sp. Soil729]|uniref:CDP-glycerol glycerophosphotransferase family protein n=1 Tax=Knoellia sp. Soil729 TaxID=1736394 RepID=UPI0006F9A3B2|nr:CDP-glycerol glycerophosphotransferase family protein [Knoellia sp. Soil729]KRE43737.1 hypothetical protein ASG74_02535 [Knoellia sp. Soil729]
MNALREPAVRRGVLAIGVWGLACAVALAGALAESGWVVAVALVVSYVADATMYAGDLRLTRWLGAHRLAAAERSLVREAVAVLAWLLAATPALLPTVAVVTAVMAVHAAHVGHRVLNWGDRRRRGGRLGWLGIDVDGRLQGPEVLPPVLPQLWTIRGPRTALHADLPVVLGLLVAVAGGPDDAPVWGAGLTILTSVLVLAASLRRSRLVLGLPSAKKDNDRLRSAVERLAPQVVVYFSGGVGTTYQLNVWLETLERLPQPTLVLIREAHHLEALTPTTLPIVVAPRATDVELIQTESMRVVLYPTTVIRNNHMIRLPGLRHVFINHGDGDKAVTYSPLHRVFDEVWVAGRAACDRYLQHGEGMRTDQLVVVGRPQLAHIERARELPDPDRARTVLYAPTWEGNFDKVDYSSVAGMGVELVDALLADPTLRVLFKPHPATGTRLRAAGDALRLIESRLAGAPNGVLVHADAGSLYEAFNDCDVLVADVSSVVADFLASRKPYLMTNPKSLPHEQLERELPSTTGATILDPAQLPRVLDLLREAMGPDSRRERREQLADYFLGTRDSDPVARFVDEVGRCVGRSQARHDVAEPVHSEGGQA